MTVYVDSANTDDIIEARRLGYVSGVTTNPTLMRKVTKDPLGHLRDILTLADTWDFYYQPCGAYSSLLAEAEEAWSLDPERVIIKVPATKDGAVLASALTDRGLRVALTAAQYPGAMLAAAAIGCHGVIPYVDRAYRDFRVDPEIVSALARLKRGNTRIIAASIKNVSQFVRAFADGADAVTAPVSVLDEVLSHPAALDAETAFLREYDPDRRAPET